MASPAPEARATDEPVQRAPQPPQDPAIEEVAVIAKLLEHCPQLCCCPFCLNAAAGGLPIETELRMEIWSFTGVLRPVRGNVVLAVRIECGLRSFIETKQSLGDQVSQPLIVGNNIMGQSVNKCAGYVGWDGRYEPQPVG